MNYYDEINKLKRCIKRLSCRVNTIVTEGDGSITSLQLTSPDSTVWDVTVNNVGALVTTEGVADPNAATSLILTAPDQTQYQVTVTNEGVLETTVI